MMRRISAGLVVEQYDVLQSLGRPKYWTYRSTFEFFGFNDGYDSQLQISTEISLHQLKNVLFRLVEWLPNELDTLVWIEDFSLSSPSCLINLIKNFEQKTDSAEIPGDSVLAVGRTGGEFDPGSTSLDSDGRMDILVGTLISCIADDLDFKVICPGSSDHLYFVERQLFAASLDPKRRHECSLSILDGAT